MNSPRHIPVMLNEVLDTLKPEAGKIYVDATFGNGGYSEAILKTVNCTVIAIDRDPTVRTRAEEIKKLYGNRFEFITGTFGDIAQLIKQPVDGVVFDIGIGGLYYQYILFYLFDLLKKGDFSLPFPYQYSTTIFSSKNKKLSLLSTSQHLSQ